MDISCSWASRSDGQNDLRAESSRGAHWYVSPPHQVTSGVQLPLVQTEWIKNLGSFLPHAHRSQPAGPACAAGKIGLGSPQLFKPLSLTWLPLVDTSSSLLHAQAWSVVAQMYHAQQEPSTTACPLQLAACQHQARQSAPALCHLPQIVASYASDSGCAKQRSIENACFGILGSMGLA